MEGERDFWEAGGLYRPSEHPVVEMFARQRTAYLSATGVLGGVGSILDVGGGSGFSSAYYAEGIRVVACDAARGMLAGNPLQDRVQCYAESLPFHDRSFDLATGWELLHHLEQPELAVREMLRVARLRIVLFEPNRNHPGHVLLALKRPSERLALRSSARYLRDVVTRAGGMVTRHIRCGLLFPNVTPLPVARLLTRLPYPMPLIGISQLLVAVRKG